MANPTFSKEDKEHILKEMDAILDGALSMGPHVNRFQEEFASRAGVDYAVAVNACTSALEIARTTWCEGQRGDCATKRS